MCIRRQVRYKCDRCGGLSRQDGSEIEICDSPSKAADEVCPTVKLGLKPLFQETTGWCDSCDLATFTASYLGVDDVLSQAEVGDAMEIERQFFAHRDRQQQPVKQEARREEDPEAMQQRFEVQYIANERHLEEQVARSKELDMTIARKRDEVEALQRQINREQSRLDQLRARRRIEEEAQDSRSARDNMRRDRQAPSSYPSRYISPERRRSSYAQADRYSTGGRRVEDRYIVVRRSERSPPPYRPSGGRSSQHRQRDSSRGFVLNNYFRA
ncbi:hypothetical protein H2200_002812 [Cladophialophora chaetospira]|uniref:Uncharacterized protein n=1 Tax=Cladophialophora chaetospira TaxID=386627 RepID=A0AA38XGW3_9EURO|nr:hypothetical protein H2200_002812 [Cladophialophora chaetospira]